MASRDTESSSRDAERNVSDRDKAHRVRENRWLKNTAMAITACPSGTLVVTQSGATLAFIRD